MEEFVFWKELIVMLVTLSCFDSGLKNDSTRGALGLLVWLGRGGEGGGSGEGGGGCNIRCFFVTCYHLMSFEIFTCSKWVAFKLQCFVLFFVCQRCSHIGKLLYGLGKKSWEHPVSDKQYFAAMFICKEPFRIQSELSKWTPAPIIGI